MDIDEENFGAYFEPQDLEHLLEEASGSQTTTDSRAVSPEAQRKPAGPPGINTEYKEEYIGNSPEDSRATKQVISLAGATSGLSAFFDTTLKFGTDYWGDKNG